MATHVAAVNAMFGSVNPVASQGEALTKRLQITFEMAAKVNSAPADVRRALFGSIKKLFDRIHEAGQGAKLDFDVSSLKSILFSSNVDIEALRLLRADVLVAVSKASPALLLKMRSEVSDIHRGEVARTVRERLENATNE